MAERTHIPSSPACGQWETLLPDALDGLLKPADQAVFSEHMAVCTACAALFEESRRGREWLEFLSPEPEIPAGLVDRILAHTGPGHPTSLPAAGPMPTPAGGVPVELLATPKWQRPGFIGFVRRFAEPRLVMTGAMAFFSIALTLNLLGLRITSVRLSDLRPTALRSFMERQLTTASVPIIRYYDHLRFVYEVQSRMRQLRSAPETEDQNQNAPKNPQPAPGESQKNAPHKDGGSRVDPPQQSADPSNWPAYEPTLDSSNGYIETSLHLEHRSAHSGGSAWATRERSIVWTA